MTALEMGFEEELARSVSGWRREFAEPEVLPGAKARKETEQDKAVEQSMALDT